MDTKNQRGQSALEYLMTYGWALIVIVVVIAALFLLIDPQNIQGDTCTGFSGSIPIINQSLTTSEIALEISNGEGKNLTDVNATISLNDGTATAMTVPSTISANDTVEVTYAPSGLTEGDQINANMTLQYNDGFRARSVTATCNGTA